MFRVLCSFESQLSKLFLLGGTLSLGLVAQTDSVVLPLVSC